MSPKAEMASPSPTVFNGCLHTSTGLRKYPTPSLDHTTGESTSEKWISVCESTGSICERGNSRGICSSNLATTVHLFLSQAEEREAQGEGKGEKE